MSVCCVRVRQEEGQAPRELESHRVVNLLMSVLEINSASLKEQQALSVYHGAISAALNKNLKNPKNIFKLCFMYMSSLFIDVYMYHV